jgi:hypothetical protein
LPGRGIEFLIIRDLRIANEAVTDLDQSGLDVSEVGQIIIED